MKTANNLLAATRRGTGILPVPLQCSPRGQSRNTTGWKPVPLHIAASLAIFAVGFVAGCSKPAEKTADAPNKAEAKPGVTIDTETQTRIGLKIESPVAMQWQPVIHAVGRVVDPLAFTAAAAEYETARAAATALAQKSARAKFTADWGVQLAAQTNLTAFGEKLQTDDIALFKLSLPVGTFPNPLPTTATIFILNNDSKKIVAAEFAGDLGIDPTTQVETFLFSAQQKLPPSISVTAELKTDGEPASGVVVPETAVLRHDGKGWVYVQAETNQFARVEIPLTALTENGWFVPENLSVTNRIVTIGAQTVLSAELSGGGFNTGARD